jgi:hypothetical protein
MSSCKATNAKVFQKKMRGWMRDALRDVARESVHRLAREGSFSAQMHRLAKELELIELGEQSEETGS